VIVGNVYDIHTTLARPNPKVKITVCMCDKDFLFFWINTAAAFNGIGQFPLCAADHPRRLSHDCFLDCSRITTFPAAELRAAIDHGPLSTELKRRIVAFLTTAPPKTLPGKHLALAIANLAPP
jgi:hypothetical protein